MGTAKVAKVAKRDILLGIQEDRNRDTQDERKELPTSIRLRRTNFERANRSTRIARRRARVSAAVPSHSSTQD